MWGCATLPEEHMRDVNQRGTRDLKMSCHSQRFNSAVCVRCQQPHHQNSNAARHISLVFDLHLT